MPNYNTPFLTRTSLPGPALAVVASTSAFGGTQMRLLDCAEPAEVAEIPMLDPDTIRFFLPRGYHFSMPIKVPPADRAAVYRLLEADGIRDLMHARAGHDEYLKFDVDVHWTGGAVQVAQESINSQYKAEPTRSSMESFVLGAVAAAWNGACALGLPEFEANAGQHVETRIHALRARLKALLQTILNPLGLAIDVEIAEPSQLR